MDSVTTILSAIFLFSFVGVMTIGLLLWIPVKLRWMAEERANSVMRVLLIPVGIILVLLLILGTLSGKGCEGGGRYHYDIHGPVDDE